MNDHDYIEMALAEAEMAAERGEVPVGAVAVHEGIIVGCGSNRRETDKDPFAHAEMRALSEASRELGRWRLGGVSLFVTLEPCAMCVGAMVHARIARVIYGARDPKTGAAGSVLNLFDQPQLNHHARITTGVLAEECGKTLSDFFARRRREHKTQ